MAIIMACVLQGFPILRFGSPYFDSLIEVYQLFKSIVPLNSTCCWFIVVAVFPEKRQALLHSNINHHSPLTFPLKIYLSSSFSFCVCGCSYSWDCLPSPLSFLWAMEMKYSSFPSKTVKEIFCCWECSSASKAGFKDKQLPRTLGELLNWTSSTDQAIWCVHGRRKVLTPISLASEMWHLPFHDNSHRSKRMSSNEFFKCEILILLLTSLSKQNMWLLVFYTWPTSLKYSVLILYHCRSCLWPNWSQAMRLIQLYLNFLLVSKGRK